MNVDLLTKLRGLDLFSGIGGIGLSLQDWVETVAYCEINTYCQAVLLSRMATNDIDRAPIWDDVKTLDGLQFRGKIDIIFGGFPCQGISVAGHGKGLEDERSGLFFEIVRLAKEIRPKLLFIENVPAITSRGGIRCLTEIASLGYDCRWLVLSASSVGALHRRERFFLLAHAKYDGTPSRADGARAGEKPLPRGVKQQKESIGQAERTSCLYSHVADPDGKGCDAEQGRKPIGYEASYSESTDSSFENDCNSDRITIQQANSKTESEHDRRQAWRNDPGQYRPFESRDDWQEIVSSICRGSDGVQNHVDKLRALGNGVVPQQVREAFQILSGIKNEI